MNILYLIEYFQPFAHGGSEWSTYYLLQGLKKKINKAVVLTPNFGTKRREIWKGILVKRFPMIKKIPVSKPSAVTPFWFTNLIFYLIAFYSIFREVVSEKIEVIHVQGNYFIPPAVWTGWILNKPVVVTLRDYQVLCPYGFCLTGNRSYRKCSLREFVFKEIPKYISNYTDKSLASYILTYLSGLRSFIVRTFLSFFLRKAAKIVCISKKQEKIFNGNGYLNTQVIYNPMLFKAKSLSTQKKDYILYVGRLTPGKGVSLLVESFKELLKKGLKQRLIIIGSGFLRNKLQKHQQIQILGQLSYNKTLEFMKKAIFVVVPSLWEEPFGRVALESLALGTPVVATNKGGLPEIIDNNKTGYVVRAAKNQLKLAMLKALRNNKKLRINIKDNYRQLNKKFYLDVISSYLKLYEKL